MDDTSTQTTVPLAPPSLDETRAALLLSAKGRFGKISPERIVEHVLRATEDVDWPVRKAALEALQRRYHFGQRDGIRIKKRPERSRVVGAYRVAGSRRSSAGPRGNVAYETALLSIEPLRMSCGCVDFVRSSLGLCKHALVVLDVLERSRSFAKPATSPPGGSRRPRLLWSPLHPLAGPADRLARLELVTGERGIEIEGFKRGRPVPSALSNPSRRRALIAKLDELVARGRLEVEPAIATLLAEEGERSERRMQAQASSASARKTLSTLHRKLYPYQTEGVHRFFEQGRLLLADDMGLGKTTQAVAACHGLFRAGSVKRGLLIVPAALKSQWKREWDSTSPVPLTIVEGSPPERAAIYQRTKRGFLVIGYEQLLRDFEHVRSFAPELVVLDEAQRIKNWATKSAAYVKALQPRYRLVLTGTPMENRFDELASIVDFVDDVALEPKWRLVPWHSLDLGNGAKGTSGARNLDSLRERLADVMLRRVRSDVLRQLPARTDTRVPVRMTEAQQAEHEELRIPIAQIMNRASRRPLTQSEFLRLMQLLTTQRIICNGLAQLRFEEEWPRCTQASRPTPALIESLCSPKLAALRDLVEQVVVTQNRKAIVFSQWRNMLRLGEWAVRDLLASVGQQARFFTGAESGKVRERAIIDFHDDPSVSMLFLSDAGGVGLNLQRAATCCINLELPWNPAVLEQRIGRIYRLGQTHPIDVYNLVADSGIEPRIAQLIAAKRAVFSSLFDGTTDEVRFDGSHSFMDGVKRLVDAPPSPEIVGEEALDAIEQADPASSGLDAFEASMEPEVPRSTLGLSDVASATLLAMLSKISLVALPDGGFRLDAPPEIATSMATLLENLARSLRAPRDAAVE